MIDFNQLILLFMMLAITMIIILIIINHLIHKNITKIRNDIFSKLEFYEQKLLDLDMQFNLLNFQNTELQVFNPKKQTTNAILTQHSNSNLIENTTLLEILGLLNDKSLTSRDIQKAIKKTREHVARLMKNLYENGYVNRNTKSRPFNYFITKKGKQVL